MTSELQTAIGKTIAQNIDNLDYTIDGVEQTITNFLGNIDNIEDYAIDLAQQKIDSMCERISVEVSDKINKQLEKMVESINNLYDSSSAIQTAINAIVNLDFDNISGDIGDKVSAIIGFLKNVQSMYIKPYEQTVKTIADFAIIAVKLTSLASKISSISSIVQDIPVHTLKNGTKLNYNKLIFNISLSQLEKLISHITPSQNS